MSTQRQQKVNSLIQREIAQYLVSEGLEGITGVVTITGVDTAPDLEYAQVFFSVIGQKTEAVAEVLKKHVYEIQGALNRKLVMRKVPRISFVFDHSGEYAQRIEKVIKDIHDEQSSEFDQPNGGSKETGIKP